MSLARSLACAAFVAMVATPAVAGADGVEACDCKRRLGLCQAEARYDGARVSFAAQTEHCARIAFSVGGESGAITIRHGGGSAALSAPGLAEGPVRVEGCYVCDVAPKR